MRCVIRNSPREAGKLLRVEYIGGGIRVKVEFAKGEEKQKPRSSSRDRDRGRTRGFVVIRGDSRRFDSSAKCHAKVLEFRESGDSFVSGSANVAESKPDNSPRENSLSIARTTRVRKTKRVRLSKSNPFVCCGLVELSSRESLKLAKFLKDHIEAIYAEVDKMLAAGIIEPSKSEWSSPIQEGLKVDPDKTAPIVEYPPPKNIKQLRRFIGMASLYRRFIPQCATRLEPLTRFLRKNFSWEWGDEQKSAFESIKSCITSPPTLSCPNFELPFTLQTDASSVGLGAVLTQESEGVEHVIAFASRALSEAEKEYSTTEQECLAVVWSIKKFRPYLEGYNFKVITDHSSLRWLHNLKNPTGRLARWALELLEYDYTIGKEHYIMFLTRCRVRDYRRIMCCRNYRRHLVVNDLEQWKLVLPKEARANVINEAHDVPQSGHLEVEKTYQRVATRYFWPRMFKEIANYVRHCDICQRTKVEQNVPMGLMGRRVVETPWTVVAADIMGSFPPSKSGNAYILGAPRVLLTDNGTEFINRELQAFADEHGIVHSTVPPYHPQANPVERVNRILKTMITAFLENDHREWDIHLAEFRFAYNTTYHTSLQATPAFLNFGREPPPVNTVRGRQQPAVEVAETNPANWKERIERIQALRNWVVENLEAAHSKQTHYYNLRRRDHRFAIGEQVLKRQHVLSSAAQNISAKLATKYHDPFTIAKMLTPVVYELHDSAQRSIGKVHIKDLKSYNVPPNLPDN
ncbi:uncharacterized protein LOC105256474 [Camponotus floridanus]|uniref:uncharacterized protein LOC105256474 n=1 Tax=Camponotus floridanus TaxID=104421 RepID=UPI000DC6C7F6|nr:uncharacterized protein LOC105256474 [Camponotus floridanus]